MTLILSGTDGLSDVDGSAATPAIRGTDANTGIFFGADIIGFAEGGAEVARFNADAQFVAAAGTASLPVITNTGNTNTGIYFETGKVNVSTGGTLRAQVDGSRLSMGGARTSDSSFESRYPASLQLWSGTALQSFSNKMSNFKNNAFATGVATAIFTFSKGAGSASSDIVCQLGGVLRISLAAQYSGGYNIAEFVEIPFSLGTSGSSNIGLQTGTQRIVTSVNNTGGGSNTYALSLSATSNIAATLALTITRTGLLNNHIGLELDVVQSAESANRILIPNQA